ncbi:MAG: permease [Firmicutes bacterium]|nr:permease [Bacillota bacterium]
MKLNKRYLLVVGAAGVLLLSAVIDWNVSVRAVQLTFSSLMQLIVILPPIFILMALLDVWVPRETLIRLMGGNSRLLGVGLAFFLGSAAAGPLYVAFPVAALLLKKGASFTNVAIFIGAWSTTKIPLMMFELAAMGPVFTGARLLINIPVISLIAIVIKLALGHEQQQAVREKAASMLE